MRDRFINFGLAVLLCCASGAWAQQAPPADPAATKAAQATAQSEAGEPRADTSSPKPAHEPSAHAAPTNAVDKLQLGTATVTGDREQPKVMYVVPWKRPDIGDAEGKPMNSLVDEILSPVDRDVFRREVRYYETVKSVPAQNGAPPAEKQVEK